MRYAVRSVGLLALVVAFCSCAWPQDPGWPRKLVKPGGTVLIYQPQVDDWQNYTDIKWRAGVSDDSYGRETSRGSGNV